MNAYQLNAINTKLQDVVSTTKTLLEIQQFDFSTVNLPVPTLHAFMSIVVGLVELIPEIHQSKYHLEINEIARQFLDLSIVLDNKLLLEDLYDLQQFKNFKANFMNLIKISLVSGENMQTSKISHHSINFQAMNLPELASIIQTQKSELNATIKTPLFKLFEQVADTMKNYAQKEGYTLSRMESVVSEGISKPTIYWTTKPMARKIREQNIAVRIRPESQSSQPESGESKRPRLTDSQTSEEML